MATLLSSLGDVVTAVFGYIPEVTGAIMESPVLLLTTGIMLIGAVCGIFFRMMSRT